MGAGGQGLHAEFARDRDRVRGRAGKKETARKCKGGKVVRRVSGARSRESFGDRVSGIGCFSGHAKV